MNGSRVSLPKGVSRPFQVFVNGVEQTEGEDFEVAGSDLIFRDELVPPRRDSARTYARLMFWGRYKTEHSVDVAFTADGARRVATALPIRPAG